MVTTTASQRTFSTAPLQVPLYHHSIFPWHPPGDRHSWEHQHVVLKALDVLPGEPGLQTIWEEKKDMLSTRKKRDASCNHGLQSNLGHQGQNFYIPAQISIKLIPLSKILSVGGKAGLQISHRNVPYQHWTTCLWPYWHAQKLTQGFSPEPISKHSAKWLPVAADKNAHHTAVWLTVC